LQTEQSPRAAVHRFTLVLADTTRQIAIALVTLTMLGAGQAFAQDRATPAPHLRADSAAVRALIDEGVRRSPTIRALVDRLNRSDVVAYVRVRDLPRVQLDGRLSFLAACGGRRYLVIELSSARTRDVQLATLGHELRHAVEIADTPAVTDSRTLAGFFARIGTNRGAWPEQAFETAGAVSAGRQAHHDLVASEPRRTIDR
jgi:hypothetical protein